MGNLPFEFKKWEDLNLIFEFSFLRLFPPHHIMHHHRLHRHHQRPTLHKNNNSCSREIELCCLSTLSSFLSCSLLSPHFALKLLVAFLLDLTSDWSSSWTLYHALLSHFTTFFSCIARKLQLSRWFAFIFWFSLHSFLLSFLSCVQYSIAYDYWRHWMQNLCVFSHIFTCSCLRWRGLIAWNIRHWKYTRDRFYVLFRSLNTRPLCFKRWLVDSNWIVYDVCKSVLNWWINIETSRIYASSSLKLHCRFSRVQCVCSFHSNTSLTGHMPRPWNGPAATYET
jgi:hypothetical protein